MARIPAARIPVPYCLPIARAMAAEEAVAEVVEPVVVEAAVDATLLEAEVLVGAEDEEDEVEEALLATFSEAFLEPQVTDWHACWPVASLG